MSVRYVISLIVLGAAALGSWYLVSTNSRDEITETVSTADASGYYLKSARILGTDDDGNLLYEIRAEFAEQLENSDIEMQNVSIRYSAGTEVPWTINADVATIAGNQDLLRLAGNVVAQSFEGFSGDETEIRTQELEIDPEAYKAETDTRVQLRIGSRSLTGTGMLALLQENRLELKSNVSGKFIP